MLLDERPEQHETACSLVRRAQAGDIAAFKQLYHQEIGRVYAVCLRMTASQQKAESYAQDTFVRAWKNLDHFREESAFSTWLHRIAVNVVLSSRRSNHRRRNHIQSTDDLTKYDAAFHDATFHKTSGSRMDLEKCIGALPTKARTVLVLHDIEGYKHLEIAKMMKIAPGTSKAHLHRARMLLKNMLEEQK